MMTTAIAIGIGGSGGGTGATTTTNAATAEITIVGETSIIVETATKTGMTSGRIEIGIGGEEETTMKTPTVAGTDEMKNERATTGETGTETAREGTNTDSFTALVLRAVSPSASQLTTSAITDELRRVG